MKKNAKLELLFQNTTMSDVIKKRKLQWAEHVWKSQNELSSDGTKLMWTKTAWKIQNKVGKLSKKRI